MKLAQLMEQLDVFISIKPKPKQPSKVRVLASQTPQLCQRCYMCVYVYMCCNIKCVDDDVAREW